MWRSACQGARQALRQVGHLHQWTLTDEPPRLCAGIEHTLEVTLAPRICSTACSTAHWRTGEHSPSHRAQSGSQHRTSVELDDAVATRRGGPMGVWIRGRGRVRDRRPGGGAGSARSHRPPRAARCDRGCGRRRQARRRVACVGFRGRRVRGRSGASGRRGSGRAGRRRAAGRPHRARARPASSSRRRRGGAGVGVALRCGDRRRARGSGAR